MLRSHKNFDKKIFIPIILLLTVLLGFFYLVNSKVIRMATLKNETQFNDNQYLQTGMAARGLQNAITTLVNEAGVVAAYSAQDYLRGDLAKEKLDALINLGLARFNTLAGYYLFVQKNLPPQRQVSHKDDQKKLDVLARKWASENWSQLPEHATSEFIARLHISRENQYMGVLLPVDAGNAQTAMLIQVIDLRPLLEEFIVPLRSGNYGAGFLLGPKGEIIYDHEEEIIGRNVFDGLHGSYPELLAVDEQLVSENSGKGEYSFTIKRNQQVSRKLISWNSAMVGSLKLTVCLSAPDTEIDSFLQETRLLQAVSTGLLLVFMLVFMYAYFRRQTLKHVRDNEERIANALEGNRDGLWDWQVSTNEVYFSPRWKEMLGYSEAELPNDFKEWESRLHPEDKSKVLSDLEKHLAGMTPFYWNEHRLLCKDGTYKWIQTRGKIYTRNRDGSPERIIGTHTDVTDRKQAELEIIKLSNAVQNSPNSVVITDTNGVIEFANESFRRVTGFDPEDVVGRRVSILRSDKNDPEIFRNLWETVSAGHRWHGEIVNAKKGGGEFWCRLSVSPVKDNSGQIINYIGSHEDISALKEQEERLRKLSTTDELTGVDNRRHFLAQATAEYRRSLRLDLPLSLLSVDLDYFKDVNDMYGHAAGDAVLIQFTRLVHRSIRDIDIFGRLGGEEFAIMLPQTQPEQAEDIAERLRVSMQQHQFNIGDDVIVVTASFGISSISQVPEQQGLDMLMAQADAALYHAKNNGRNRVSLFVPEMMAD